MSHILSGARPERDKSEMGKIRSALCFIVLLMMSQFSSAQAVCLTGHLSIQDEFDTSLYVVTATEISAMKVGPRPEDPFSEGTNYLVRVGETIKGHPKKNITLFSENSTGRFPLDHGKSYLLFISKDEDRLSVDNCGNSGLLKISETALTAAKAVAKNTPHWPRIAEIRKTIYVADAHATDAGLDFNISGAGKPLYEMKCHPGEYNPPKYSGLVQCYVLPRYSKEMSSNLLNETADENANQSNRSRFLDHQVVGACGNYFEFGKNRNFFLRGMRIAITLTPTAFQFPLDKPPSVESYALTISVTPATEITSARPRSFSFFEPNWFNQKTCPGEGSYIKQ